MATNPVAINTSLKPEEIRSQFTLPSGKQVIVRRGKGRDLRTALMAAGPKADQYRILFAIIARLALIDGKPTTMEAIDEMDFDDSQMLLAEAGNAISPLAKTLQAPEAPEESGGQSSLLQ